MYDNLEEKIKNIVPIKLAVRWTHSSRTRDHYKVTLKANKRQATFPFFQGFGVVGPPTLDRVLYALMLDSQEAIDFEGDLCGFMFKFGYNETEKAEALRILNQVKKVKDKMEILGILEYLDEFWALFNG